MLIDNLIGKRVTHKSYGLGTIKSVIGSHIVVNFDIQSKEKTFIYPECFDHFLEFFESSDRLTAKPFSNQEVEKIQSQYFTNREEYNRSSVEKHRPPQQQYGQFSHVTKNDASIDSFCDVYGKALVREIAFLRENGGKRQRIFDGKLIEKKNGSYLYSFESDSELNYPDGTQITLWVTTAGIQGTIVCCEDFTITIATSISLGEKLVSIEFSAESWRLLSHLLDHLRRYQSINGCAIAKELICDGKKKIQHYTSMQKGQDNACKMANSQPITFIWGPPGTGKTETLARISLQHIQRGNRVLMLSYSNVSVDGAILRVFNRDPQQQPGKLVRYGYPRDKDLLQHEYLTAYNLVIQRHPDLLRERTNLQNERKHTPKDTPRYVEISKRLMHIRNNLDCEEKRAVQEAKFVATTVSKAVADKTIYDDSFDVVIFDEASMAYIPQIVNSAKLAKKHFICMGDFAQLPPIVQAKSNAILNMDIFEYCGITEAVRNHNSHEWLCLLDTQYRMHPDIANFSSMAMCQSLLKSASDMEIRRKSISNTSPLMYYPLGLADLTGMMSVCTQTADSSRINPLSALVSFGLALKSAEHHDVGIITPYHAQSRLFHAMARDALGEETELHTISCATVHQFQGSEKDIIIYDAVDCYRQRYPSALLTSTSNNYASRLFNVALTRARGKFIAVANIAYMESKNLSHDLMFTKLIDKYKYTARCLQGKVYDKEFVNYQGSMYAWLDEHQGEILFIDDIKDAKSEIRIDIPGEIKADNAYIQRISHALCLAQKRGIRIIIRAEDRNKIPQSLRPFSIQNSYVANAISIIDKKIVWFGEPLSSANFVSGENIIPTKYRPIIRFKGRHTAMSLYGFLEMNRTIDDAPSNHDDGEQGETFAQYIASHSICEICGKPMRLKKSKGFFLGCSGYPKCNHTEKIDVDFVEEYFRSKGKRGMRCPQCNCSLEATRGQYGVYIRCCGLNRHRYRFDEV